MLIGKPATTVTASLATPALYARWAVTSYLSSASALQVGGRSG